MAVFLARDGGFLATDLARGPWDPGAQHGGAPAALLMRAFEQVGQLDGTSSLALARVTYEFLRPVPIGELRVDASVVRDGRRVQLLEGSISSGDAVVVRARALAVQRVDSGIPASASEAPPPGPQHGHSGGFEPPHRPMFAPDAIEIRFVAGQFGGGPSTAWFKLRVPVVDGEEPSPLQLLAAAGDFGNGISAILPWSDYLFINPDLTLYIERAPVGDWICLDSRTSIAENGIGTAESTLFDQTGRVGRAVQALLVAER